MDKYRRHSQSYLNDIFLDNSDGLYLKISIKKKTVKMTKATSSTQLQRVETKRLKKTNEQSTIQTSKMENEQGHEIALSFFFKFLLYVFFKMGENCGLIFEETFVINDITYSFLESLCFKIVPPLVIFPSDTCKFKQKKVEHFKNLNLQPLNI